MAPEKNFPSLRRTRLRVEAEDEGGRRENRVRSFLFNDRCFAFVLHVIFMYMQNNNERICKMLCKHCSIS